MENRKYITIDNLTFKDVFRFFRKINIPDDPKKCWEWTGSKRKGYGLIAINNTNIGVTRLSFFIFHERDPFGLDICHTCDNPGCVNPNHLFTGTINENNQDKIRKGRGAKGESMNTAKLTWDQVNEMRTKKENGTGTLITLAKEYGVTRTHVWNICSYKTWK